MKEIPEFTTGLETEIVGGCARRPTKEQPLSDEGKGTNDYWKGKVNKNYSNPSLPSGRFFIYINMDRQKRRKPKAKQTISWQKPSVPACQQFLQDSISGVSRILYIKKVTTRPGSGRMPIACRWFVLWLPLGCQVSGVWLAEGRRLAGFCVPSG